MDEEKQKIENALYDLSGVIMANERAEAQAVEGYNLQLKKIAEVKELIEGSEEHSGLSAFLDALEAATKEKISDELNHGQSLYEEYVEFTGIEPAKD